MNKKVIIAIIVVVIAGTVFLLLRQKNTNPKPAYSFEKTVTISRGDLNVMVSATGTVQPINKVEVKCKASGQIMEFPVEEGDFVKKGDLIARLDETDTRNDYKQAKANLEVAKATVRQSENEFQRQQDLFNKGLISVQAMDQARLNLVKAKAELIKAETNLATMATRLKDTKVRSPISGIILQKNVEAGQIIASGISSVTGGTLIATVARMDSVYVMADVDEVDIGQVLPGQKAKVVADAFPDDVFWGTVIRISPLAHVEQNVTTFRVTIKVPNTNNKLKAGMNASVDITIADRRNVLLVPREALKDPRDVRGRMAALIPADSTVRTATLDSLRAQRRRQFMKKYRDKLRQLQARGDREAMRKLFRSWIQQQQKPTGLSTEQGKVKVVMLKQTRPGGQGATFVPHIIKIGVSNFDYAEVLDGLKEGDQVQVTSVSRAQQQRQEFLNRLRSRAGFSGLRR